MSVLESVFAIQSRSAQSKVTAVGSGGFFGLFGSSNTAVATSSNALTLSAFYNGVDQLSNDLAKLPKLVLKKDGESRIKFSDHPVNYLISQRPNDLMNAFDLWKIVEVSTIIKGNAYVRIFRNKSTGYPESLIFLDHCDVEVFRSNNKLFYKYKGAWIDGADMLHFKGFSFDGIMGVGIIAFAAKQLGVSLQAQIYNGEIYKDRGLSYGVIESELSVTNENKQAISEGFTAKMMGKDPHKVPVLDEGMHYKSITITPAEAQFLESNKQGWLQVCQWLNVAPHKIKILDNANYSNIYQQSIEHVQDSMMPRAISKEQELNNKLFAREESGIIYTRFNLSALLRGDLEMKQKFYTAMIYAGVYTRNEVRAMEDMNPIDGLDEILQPVNMQALSIAMEIMKQNEKDGKNNA